MIIATTWSKADRDRVEVLFRESGDRGSITWVVLEPGEILDSVVDRRGGVDLLLGGSFATSTRLLNGDRLVVPTPSNRQDLRRVVRPMVEDRGLAVRPLGLNDPRVDRDSRSMANLVLKLEGWSKGYDGLVRAAARSRPIDEGRVPVIRSESLTLVKGGPHPIRAQAFMHLLELRELSPPLAGDEFERADADELLADLLGAALVDSLDELREANAALERFGHPARAEAAIGERPPWPPASITKLRSDPNGGSMLDTLLDQIAPDPVSRAWLVESWSKPGRSIDGDLLTEIVKAADGRLVREPRFRSWLRVEWTAWTRQLYRRVVRVAGGSIPS